MGNLQSQVPRCALRQIPPGQCLGWAGRGATQGPPGDRDTPLGDKSHCGGAATVPMWAQPGPWCAGREAVVLLSKSCRV